MTDYISSLTPLKSALVVSGIATSTFFIGNVTHTIFGIIPILQAPTVSLEKKAKADAFTYFYERAKYVFAGSAIASTAAFAAIAYLRRQHQGTLTTAMIGAVTSGMIAPWTVSQMAPVNDQLMSIAAGDVTKEAYVDPLIEKWRQMHNVRLVLGGISYFCALVLADTI